MTRVATFAIRLVLVLLAAAPQANAQTPAVQPPRAEAAVTLEALEKMALESNPTLQAARAQIDAARGRARQAGTWPNPTVGFTAEEIKTGDRDRRGEYGFFVEQPILLGGKLRLGRSVFERDAEVADAALELQRQRILGSVRRAFYEVLTIERRAEVHGRLAALASEAIAVTAQLFNVGAADRPDYLESEIEARRLDLELARARDEAFAARQQLAAVVGVAEIAGRALAGTIDRPLPEMEREAALRQLLDESPQIRAARAAIARAQALTAVARKETFPDLFVRGGAAYNREHGEDSGKPIGWEAALEAGVTIPLFNRNRGGIAAAEADERRAQAELARLELALRSQLASEFAMYLSALREAETYRNEILPRAEEAYRLYLARYREMGAAYPQVMVAQRNLFELSSRYLESLEELWRTALRIQTFLAGDGLDQPEAGGADSEGSSRTSRGEHR